jgi:hypothetical protein
MLGLHARKWLLCPGLILAGLWSSARPEDEAKPAPPLVPVLKGDWWTVAANPDLGDLTRAGQQVVDFGLWQAADGTWQLWSCIRLTNAPGKTRLFHRWEGQRLTDRDWKPLGIAMQADEKFGETPGGLQAPFVLRRERDYLLFYGDWVHICAAVSQDGKQFTRRLDAGGKAGLFSDGPEANTRDPMVLRSGDLWYCYYTAHPGRKGAVYCRTSKDLITWGPSHKVAASGRAGTEFYSAECPFVVEPEPGHFYLFRTQRYLDKPLTRVYHSTDPLRFGIDEDDRYLVGELPVAAPELVRDGKDYYLAALLPTLQGIRITRLEWVRRP